MNDTIALRGIRAWGHHGADPGEGEIAQPFDIDLTFALDLRAARASDELSDTVDYAAIHATIVRIVALERWRLLERLGERILESLMEDGRIVRATIAIAKPRLLGGATPVVTLHRDRG